MNTQPPSSDALAVLSALSSEEQDELDNDPEAGEDAANTNLAGTTARERFNGLVRALENAQPKIMDPPGSPLPYLCSISRLTMREHGPHLEVAQAVSIGLTICSAPTPEDASNMCTALRKIPKTLLDRYTALGQWLLEQLPYLREILLHLNNDKAAMILFSKYVDRYARAGRANDLRTLKKNMHGWVPITSVDHPDDPDAAPLVFSPFKKDGTFDNERANWGWNGTWSARLLVWLTARNDFDRNVDHFMEQVRCGHICMNHVGFPAFLYDVEAMDVVSSNPKDFEVGLFRGPMMISAFRCLWTSPDSATKPPGAKGKGRASISRMHGITDVTAEQIAYVACLMRHVLSSETSWDKQNVKIFDGAAFFNNIVKLFSRRRRLSAEVRDLYRLYAYGTQPGDGGSNPAESQFELLMQASDNEDE